MGGAGTAAPIDAMGALYWNPASISGLANDEMSFGVDLLMANHRVDSSFGPLSGSTQSDPGVFPIPNVGWIHKTQNPSLTIGLGVHGVAGFKTNLPSDTQNPVLMAPPNGLGSITSEGSFLQIAPVGSLALTDQLSVAAGPTITMGQIGVDPFVFDSPNANGSYANGRSSRYHWGAGFQLGTYYIVNPCWRLGASLKSPTWMETFEFYSTDANGGPRTLHTDLDLPLILSLGTSFTNRENLLVALDVRYFDYQNTNGLGDRATFDATGRLMGLDWSSVLSTAVGMEYKLWEQTKIRCGYTYNQNPVRNSEAFFNLASPLIYQHMVSCGGSYMPTESVSMNAAYSYMLPNTRTGPIFSPLVGAIPGTSLSNHLDAHFLSFGVSVFL